MHNLFPPSGFLTSILGELSQINWPEPIKEEVKGQLEEQPEQKGLQVLEDLSGEEARYERSERGSEDTEEDQEDGSGG